MKFNLKRFKEVEIVDFKNLNENEKVMVLKWRNHPEIRKWMYNSDIISYEEHINFLNSLNNSKKIYFLVKNNRYNIGVLTFKSIDEKELFFGMYANPFEKIPASGWILEEIAIKYTFNVLKKDILSLEVFSENKKVINLHKQFNFKITGEKVINNKNVICMKLRREDVK